MWRQSTPSCQRSIKKFRDTISTKHFTHDILGLNEELGKSFAGRDDTITQVNKFYNLVRVAESQSAQNEELAKIQVKLHVLKAQIAYATARETLSKDFKEFFDISITKILKSNNLTEMKESLKAFTTFFESVYAYFYYHTKANKEDINQ
ncbi:MAG: type III-A CRISPR-associated protein Csm2 [Blastocatellia bacterium]|nr:type III-A CRISPR-associated protein Csm2 [Blastocatellia bacterium]